MTEFALKRRDKCPLCGRAMNSDALIALVAEMRHAQKEFFRTHSATALEESKRLEKQVDKALEAADDKQTRLFE